MTSHKSLLMQQLLPCSQFVKNEFQMMIGIWLIHYRITPIWHKCKALWTSCSWWLHPHGPRLSIRWEASFIANSSIKKECSSHWICYHLWLLIPPEHTYHNHQGWIFQDTYSSLSSLCYYWKGLYMQDWKFQPTILKVLHLLLAN